MVSLNTVAKVQQILRERALALGLSVSEIRARYPAKQVRRNSIMESLQYLEELRLIEWRGKRVRWVGPIPDDARPLGISMRRLQRDAVMDPRDRVMWMVTISDELAWNRGAA